MAAVAVPTKFAKPTNSHLVCSVCKNVYSEPVINVKCGHTFCRACVMRQTTTNNVTKCPVDAVTCDLGQLVINRALQSQVEDLDIYCRHGLTWSDEKNGYINDPHGCPDVIKYADRRQHEDKCDFAVVSCPNSEKHCGKLKRKDLQAHLHICQQYSCQFKTKGCKFVGSQIAVVNHTTQCGYRGLQDSNDSSSKIAALEASNRELKTQVKDLRQKVDNLEKERSNHDAQLANCHMLIEKLQEQMKEMEGRLSPHVTSPVRRSQSAVEMKRKSGDPDSTRVLSRSISPRGPRLESWTMPLQFKCIGTLKGHVDTVWDLKTSHNWLFSAGDDKVIKVWDLEDLTHGCQQTLRGHKGNVQCLATSEKYVYSGSDDLSICMWSIAEKKLIKTVEKAHEQVVAALVCTQAFLFSSSHREIKVWAADSLAPIHTSAGLHHWVRALALSPKQDVLYSGSHNAIEMWDTGGKMRLCGTIHHKHGSVHALAVTDKYIIAGTYNQNIAVFDVQGKLEVQKLTGHVGTIMNLKASPSGRFLFSSSSDAMIQLWNLENMLPVQALQRHEGSVNCLVIHNDLLLSGAEDSEIKVFKYFKMQPGFIPS